jgi:hypothetical protein
LYGCETWYLTLREEREVALDNRLWRIIFGTKWEEVSTGWRRLHNEELHNLYTSPDIFRVIKSMGMRWTRHVERNGEMDMHTKFWMEILKGRDHSQNLGIDGKIILKCILRRVGRLDWIYLVQDRDQWRAAVKLDGKFLE